MITLISYRNLRYFWEKVKLWIGNNYYNKSEIDAKIVDVSDLREALSDDDGDLIYSKNIVSSLLIVTQTLNSLLESFNNGDNYVAVVNKINSTSSTAIIGHNHIELLASDIKAKLAESKLNANHIDVANINLSSFKGSLNYNRLSNTPTIPTKISQLQNDSGFITISSVPTKVSQLQNDSKFVKSESITTIWKGTSAQYNALSSKSNSTLYLITT